MSELNSSSCPEAAKAILDELGRWLKKTEIFRSKRADLAGHTYKLLTTSWTTDRTEKSIIDLYVVKQNGAQSVVKLIHHMTEQFDNCLPDMQYSALSMAQHDKALAA